MITGSGSSSLDLDHYSIWIIITGSGSSLDHHGCYLMILLITGSSIEPSFFHVGCRPSHHVGLRPALTSDLLVRKAHPALTSDHVGTNPIIISERPNTHIHQHDRTSLSSVKRLQHLYLTYSLERHIHPGENTSYHSDE